MSRRTRSAAGGKGAGHWRLAHWAHDQDPRPCRRDRQPTLIEITPGNTSDVVAAETLVARAGRLKQLMADRGYDADWLRRKLCK